MASARVFFSKHRRGHRNGFINEEVPVVENGYDGQESDEDEVFVKDPNIEVSASKPLMHPRSKAGHKSAVRTRTIECRLCRLCKPIFYFVALVTVLCGVMAAIVYAANQHSNQHSGSLHAMEGNNGAKEAGGTDDIISAKIVIGCDQVKVEDVWVVGFPKLLTESAIRLVDVDGDDVLDVLLGFATGADGYGVKDIVCDIYFGGNTPCFGGVLALEGATGRELWRIYAQHEVYGLNCQYDLDSDGVKDCLAAGRAGTFFAVSCRQGKLLWSLGESEAVVPVMNFYTPQYIRDIDGDGVADVVTTHGGDPLQEAGSAKRLSGRVLLVSGKTGRVLRWIGVPDNRETYYSPQILERLGQVSVLLFGTGGETHNGSLWEMEVESLLEGATDRVVKLSSDTHKGFMAPAALADVTGDGLEDILVPVFNSTLLALDGGGGAGGHKPLWTARFPGSETYSTPAVGYYNEDDTPDFLVKYAHGPGYPLYYFSQTTVVDGKSGKRLIDPPLRDTIGSQASALTVALEGQGNDIFLTWMADCEGHEGQESEFEFVKGTGDREKSRSDFCRLLFKTEGISKMIALGRNLPKQGVLIYQSEKRKDEEHSKWVNTSAEAYEYIMKHPELLERLTVGDGSSAWSSEDDQVESSYLDVPQEHYRAPQYNVPHRIGSKKGPSGSGSLANDRLSEYPGRAYSTREGGARKSSYNKGNNRGYSNNGYGGSYYPAKSPLLPDNSMFGSSASSSSSSAASSPSYRGRSGNTGSRRGGYYGTPYDSLYPSNDDRGDDIYSSRGYPYKYGRSVERRAGDRQRVGGAGIERRKSDEIYPTRRKKKHWDIKRRKIPDSSRYMRKRRRKKRRVDRRRRHVGPHDDGGFQRLLSTGHLAPSTLPTDHPDSGSVVDLVFATYWLYPVRTQAILPEDRQCIADQLALEGDVRFDPTSQFYQMDHSEYEEAITKACLDKSDHQLPIDGIYSNSDDEYNPFDLNMGQMTVYRLRLKFSCSQPINATDAKCASVLPFEQQKWAGYMGSNGDSHWSTPVHKTRPKPRLASPTGSPHKTI